MSNIQAISDDSFEQEVAESDLPVLVDFGRNGAALVRL